MITPSKNKQHVPSGEKNKEQKPEEKKKTKTKAKAAKKAAPAKKATKKKATKKAAPKKTARKAAPTKKARKAAAPKKTAKKASSKASMNGVRFPFREKSMMGEVFQRLRKHGKLTEAALFKGLAARDPLRMIRLIAQSGRSTGLFNVEHDPEKQVVTCSLTSKGKQISAS